MIQRMLSRFTLLCGLSTSLLADDWPQWMGPTRDGIWYEKGTVDKFPEDGPPVKWRVSIHGGYAGPAVAGGRVFVTDYAHDGEAQNDPGKKVELEGRERVLCLDAKTGDELWKYEYPCAYKISYPAGPRATPTVDGDRVYTLGAEGDLFCLKTENGAVVWSKELKEEYQTTAPHWGFSGHPLIDGDKLICLVGGKGSVVVAFDKLTGQELWRALSASEEAGYCPPSIIEFGGVRQLIEWTPDAIHSLNPETGEEYWSQPLKPDYGMSIMMPRQVGDHLFASGIGEVGALFKLSSSKPAASIEWKGTPKNSVYCANMTPIVDNGTMYGADCKGGQFRAVDFETGKRLWETFAPTTGNERGSHGTAFLVQNGRKFFIFSETGDLILAKLRRRNTKKSAGFTSWSRPVNASDAKSSGAILPSRTSPVLPATTRRLSASRWRSRLDCKKSVSHRDTEDTERRELENESFSKNRMWMLRYIVPVLTR